MKNIDDVICPPCGEQPLAPEGFYPGVALATKRGATKESPILPLLPRLMAVLPPQGREIISRGFTLIELLVVVLIIGILAAVAVPQYQKVVDKQKLLPIMIEGKTIREGLKLFMLENGRDPVAKELGIWDSFNEEQNAYYLQKRRYYWLGGWYVRSYFPLGLTCDWALKNRKGEGTCSTNNQRTINLLKSIGWEVQSESNGYAWFYIPGMKERIVKP